MTFNVEQVRTDFRSIKQQLDKIAVLLEEHLKEVFKEMPSIDRITCRVKGEDSFINKVSNKDSSSNFKYEVPMKEIQDFLGARIIVYYKNDAENVAKMIPGRFNTVEENRFVPEDVSSFGYEGVHFMCFIPNFLLPNEKNPLLPDFFELQIKTLYQHAWSQANHGLGYKPGTSLTEDEKRRLAFVAAQSWGADSILSELYKAKTNI